MQSIVVELPPSAAEVLPKSAADAGDAGVVGNVEARVVTFERTANDGNGVADGAAGGGSEGGAGGVDQADDGKPAGNGRKPNRLPKVPVPKVPVPKAVAKRVEKVKKVASKEHITAAQRKARLQMVVKLTPMPEVDDSVDLVLNSLGMPMRIEKFPYLPKSGLRSQNYSLPTGVRLLLNFQIECAGVFMIMALLCSGSILDNVQRNDMRSSCREAASTPEGYLVLTQPPGASITASMREATQKRLGFAPEDCGWTGLPVRPFPSSTLYEYQPNGVFFLRTALGGCQEFATLADNFNLSTLSDPAAVAAAQSQSAVEKYAQCMQPRGFLTPATCGELLIDTPASNYCFGSASALASSRGNAWAQLLALLVFVMYLVRLRWDVCRVARLEDDAIISTADYALQISGLNAELPADDLHDQLLAELEALEDKEGSFAGQIHHIEVGRHCKDEIHVINQLRKLDTLAEELQAKKRFLDSRGESLAPVEKQFEKLKKDHAEAKTKLDQLISEADMATGHAFVVFKRSCDRDRLARLFVASKENLYTFLHPSKRSGKRPTLKCAAPTPANNLEAACKCSSLINPFFWLHLFKGEWPEPITVHVSSAPEPDEVLRESTHNVQPSVHSARRAPLKSLHCACCRCCGKTWRSTRSTKPASSRSAQPSSSRSSRGACAVCSSSRPSSCLLRRRSMSMPSPKCPPDSPIL